MYAEKINLFKTVRPSATITWRVQGCGNRISQKAKQIIWVVFLGSWVDRWADTAQVLFEVNAKSEVTEELVSANSLWNSYRQENFQTSWGNTNSLQPEVGPAKMWMVVKICVAEKNA